MKRTLSLDSILLFAALLAVLVFPAGSQAAEKGADPGEVLDAAESVFRNMQKRDYPALWGGLSAKTRQSIVASVQKAESKAGRDHAEAEVRTDLETGGRLSREFWDAYLVQFNPGTVLEESRWTMGEIKKDRAEIAIRYKKSEHDAILKLFREGGAWKVGLDETFSTRQ